LHKFERSCTSSRDLAEVREILHKFADDVLEMEGISHQVVFFLVSSDRSIRGVAEARQAAKAVTENGSKLTIAPPERVRELSSVLHLVKT
jgi:hypothetical protein